MKVWILLALTLFVFSGCSTKTQNRQLRAMNAKQAAIIKQQQAQIAALQSKVRTRELMRKAARLKAKKLKEKKLKAKKLKAKKLKAKKRKATMRSALPKPPKRKIVLKKVEDKNYSSSYMYPGAQNKAPAPKPAQNVPSKTAAPQTAAPQTAAPQTAAVPTSSTMTRVECISMIGQAKFDKYTQMFGNEAASLKRCKMLKAMK